MVAYVASELFCVIADTSSGCTLLRTLRVLCLLGAVVAQGRARDFRTRFNSSSGGGNIVLQPGADTAEAVWAKRGFFQTPGKWMVKPVPHEQVPFEGPALAPDPNTTVKSVALPQPLVLPTPRLRRQH